MQQPQVQSARPSVSYYAPRAIVKVHGQMLPESVIADFISVNVDLDLEQLGSVSLTINNWDSNAKKPGFKYSDSPLFDVGHRIHIELGYADKVWPVVHGIITSMTPAFPEAGPPTIAIRGQDALVMLRDRQPTANEQRKFEQKTDGEIAAIIAARNKLVAHVPDRLHDTKPNPVVYQRDLDDAQFLYERARRIDFDCYIDEDPTTGKDALYFVSPADGRAANEKPPYELLWGRDLIQFSPTITIARQIASVTVRGWDDVNKKVILGTANANDIPNKTKTGKSGPELVAERLLAKEKITVDRPVQSKQEADDLAKAILRDRAYTFITGTGQCIGQPQLSPGDNLILDGLGERYSGKYYVTKVTHNLGAQGYLTDFTVRRDFDGGIES